VNPAGAGSRGKIRPRIRGSAGTVARGSQRTSQIRAGIGLCPRQSAQV